MEEIKFNKKYLMSCYDYESEGIYLGTKMKKNLINKHFFMVWHSFMNKGDVPIIIACNGFKIKEGNRLETLSISRYFPKLNTSEINYLTELAKRYWNE